MPEEIFEPLDLPPGWTQLDYEKYRNKILTLWLIVAIFATVGMASGLMFLGVNSFMAQSYGRLDRETWRDDLSRGFSECFRVLKTGGVLIFKWNECDVPLSEVLKCTNQKPLFGHPSGKAHKTHWCAFWKPNDALCDGGGEKR